MICTAALTRATSELEEQSKQIIEERMAIDQERTKFANLKKKLEADVISQRNSYEKKIADLHNSLEMSTKDNLR